MTHDGTLDFLEILGRVFVDNDASKNPDADDDDDEPEVEEVHEWGCPGSRRKDVKHELKGLSPVVVQHSVQGQSLVGIQTHLVTDGLKVFVEIHEVGRFHHSCGVGIPKVPVVRVLILQRALEQQAAMELELPGLDLVSCGRCIVAFGIPEEPKECCVLEGRAIPRSVFLQV